MRPGITTVLTLSTLAIDTRTDLPKVHYATALDWFILITFGYCMASLIQFASVHYFTKVSIPRSLLITGEKKRELDLKRRPTFSVGNQKHGLAD